MRTAASSNLGATESRAAPIIGVWREPPPFTLRRQGTLVERWGRAADGLGFAMLIMAVGALLFRPADMFPALTGKPIYEVCVAGCSIAALPRLAGWLAPRSLMDNAIASLVLLLVPAVMLSHLSHADTYDARMGGIEALKASFLFLLVVSLVTSPAKLRSMLGAVAGGVLAMTVLAVLQFHGYLHMSGLDSVEQRSSSGDPAVLIRLCGIGVFNDPNDLALILVVAIVACVYGLGERRLKKWRALLVFPLALFGYGLILTHSRGGMMSAAAALVAFLPARMGWRNALPLILCLAGAVMILPSWGRETSVDLDNPEDTFQTRLDLWGDSLDAFRAHPIFGIGQGKLADMIGAVAHNSFLHAFAELGMLGGGAFVGVFYHAVRGLWRSASADPEVARMRPYMLAMTVGYVTGLLSLSRCYAVPTYLVLALATAYLVLAQAGGAVVMPRLDGSCLRRITGVSVVFLVMTYLFVRLMIQPGHA